MKPRGRSLVFALAAALLVLAGCEVESGEFVSGEEEEPEEAVTTTTAPEQLPLQQRADLQAVMASYQEITEAFTVAPDAGLSAIVQANYPGMGNTVEACAAALYPGGIPPALRVRQVVDPHSFEPAPDWTIDDGPLAGTAPDGRVYSFTVTETVFTAGDESTEETEEHATVLPDGSTKLFVPCG